MAVDILRARGRGAEAAVLAREWGRALAVREIARAVAAENALKGVAAVLLAAVGEVGEVAALFADADEREQADFIIAGARG
jgi:aspartate aminotransferase-like enzyme